MKLSLWPGLAVAWSVLLIGSLLWPFALPGILLHRDMAVIAHPALSESALGFGDLPARNAPQDGLLALVGTVIDASWFARGLLVIAATLGALGAVHVARHCAASKPATLLALTITLVNPFVVERLLQGQWSLVIAAWLLPGIAVWSLSGTYRLLLPAMWLASLTPTGAVVALIVALTAAFRRPILAYGLLLTLPWLIPSILAAPPALPAGGSSFAARAEHLVGTVGAVLGLGGIWNSAAVPASRESGFALAGVLLFVILASQMRRIPKRLTALAIFGICGAILLTFAPRLAETLVGAVPGAALFRDSHKLVLFAIPAYAFLAARVRPVSLVVVGLLAAVLHVWDAPLAVDKLQPVPEPPTLATLQEAAKGRDVFVPGLGTLTRDGSVNPLVKAVSMVENGELRVDGTLVDAPSPRFTQATELYNRGDLEGLASLGVGVIYDGAVTELAPPTRPSWRWWLGLSLLLSWLALGAASLLVPARARRAPAGQ
ncbi:hypothetical protein CKALI_01170 [Corynebacterium kalinowskii]|uniref:Transmembrane protein n=1 Tax=Corynebacterium kalinowskii TaxID=2675216 RepID=A0A6B8VHR2_9CORY|nr:hypothetical protein [Corynebacterium kalinowskii]QGU01134.1 hypothetical protein CKALI_01170 [Corynebacterium kalinowskii]